MFKNIGRRIQLLAMILAIVSFVACLALAVFFLISTIGTQDDTLRTAGIQGTVVSVVLALLLPLLTWLFYGFGSLILCSEKRLETERETKELLRHALAEGALSEDISRKLSQAIAKLNLTTPASNARPAQPVQPIKARPVAKPVARPAQPAEQAAEPAPVAKAEAPIQQEQPAEPAAPVKQAEPPAPAEAAPTQIEEPKAPTPRPVRQANPLQDLPPSVQPLKPFGKNDQTY